MSSPLSPSQPPRVRSGSPCSRSLAGWAGQQLLLFQHLRKEGAEPFSIEETDLTVIIIIIKKPKSHIGG